MAKLRKADSSKRRSHLNVTYYGYLVVAALVIALMPDVSFAEEITLTTILPRQDILRTRKGVVGKTYRDPQVIANADIPDDSLLVEGNVGIGTTEPETMLTIQGEGEMGVIGDWKDKGLLIGWDTDNVFFGLKDEGSDRKDAVIAWGDNGAAGAGAGVADNLRFILKDSGAGGQDYEYMRIAYNGNVGIGTTEPDKKLTINGGSNSIGFQNSGTTEWHVGYLTSGLNFAETAQADGRLFLKDGGNVGIGTTEPDATLEVKGTMKVFGAWETKSENTVYQAASDGFVTAHAWDAHLAGYTDASSNPTIMRVRHNLYHSGSGSGITMPVKKGHYWKVTRNGGSAATVYWMPLGGR